MPAAKQYIQNNKTAFFDWLVFGVSMSMGFIFPTLMFFIISPVFSYLILSALVLYIAGSWLKYIPLYYRLRRKEPVIMIPPYTIFLIIGHWCILFAVVVFASGAIQKILGTVPPPGKTSNGGILTLTSMFAAAVITWLVYRSRPKVFKDDQYSDKYLFRRELIADALLVVSISIFSFGIWEKGILTLLANRQINQFSDVGFLFIFLALGYMLCYLPLRYFFLVEDHHQVGTWKRMLLIFGFLLVRALFQLLNL